MLNQAAHTVALSFTGLKQVTSYGSLKSVFRAQNGISKECFQIVVTPDKTETSLCKTISELLSWPFVSIKTPIKH
jgi:hypothetical protein